MSEDSQSERRRRNRNFEDTHRILIEKAVELISDRGAESLSISALARESGINRSTVYYHFDSRETLIEAVRRWSSDQIAQGFNPQVSQNERVSRITGFVLANPEVTKLWIEDFIAPGDIRERYPMWDGLVSGVARQFGGIGGEGDIDAEVFCTIMLTGALIGPRVFRNSVQPDIDMDQLVERFSREQMRLLRAYGLLSSETRPTPA